MSPRKSPKDVPSFNVQVVPGKLSVQVYRHEVDYFKPVPCWTFITEGLWAHKQKEVVLTLRRDAQGDNGEPPRFPLQIIESIYRLAAQGKLVDTWGYSYFVLTAVKERKAAVFYVAYLYPLPLSGIRLPSPALTAILMSKDDYEVFRAFGLTRLVAARGNHYRYYPCPPWSELPLPEIVSMQRMQRSLLGKMPRIHLQGSTVTMEGSDITLRLQPKAQRILESQLGKIEPNQPLALLPELDPKANACLTWNPEKNITAMNVPPNSDLSQKAGCFVAFIPEQAENSSRIFEDGFVVMVTTNIWMKIREAMVSGQPVVVPTEGTPRQFRLEYVPSA